MTPVQHEPYAQSMAASRGQQGQISQLPDGRWRARYREQGRAGKRPQATFDTRHEAAEWLRAGLGDAARIAGGDTSTLVRRREQNRTVDEAIRDFLAALEVSDRRIATLAERLRLFSREFGDRPIQTLETYELQAWRKTISAGYRHDVFKAAKQMLRQAHAWHWVVANPADGIKNPEPRRPEITPLGWPAILQIRAEIDLAYEALPVFAAGTGLRPEEWIPLERGDIDVERRLVHVRRVYSDGHLLTLGPEGAKTKLQRRSVPLRQVVVVDELAAKPPRIDTPLLWPAKTGGGYLNLDSFRRAFWKPALEAADVPHQRIYDLRHTYATDLIAAGIDLFTISRRMGTSVDEIDKTYGHLAPDAADRELALLDGWDALRTAEA